jgi:hypothetical protein
MTYFCCTRGSLSAALPTYLEQLLPAHRLGFLELGLLGALLLAPVCVEAKPHAAQVAKQIDRLIAIEVSAEPAELAPICDDTTYLRRVWLDLVGDIPTPEHVTAFLLDPRVDKRARVVHELLDHPEFGQNWGRYWRDVIMYRRIEERVLSVSNLLVADLATWFNENHSWDQITTKFFTALGGIHENGATAIIAAQEGRTEQVAAEMSRIFLGIQIQCAQCHDHPYDRWKREQFHELAAFYPRVMLRRMNTPTQRSFEVTANDQIQRGKPRKNGNRPGGNAEHRMPDLDDPSAPGTEMQPKFFLTGTEVPLGTLDRDRRRTLAELVTRNDWFSTAYVNRMWLELVGEGFYESVDDLGPDRESSAPQTIATLSIAFADNGYDVKWLFRTICKTDAYQRESRPRSSTSEKPFTANVAQRLRGDQLFNSLMTALEIDETRANLKRSSGRSPGNYGRRITPRSTFVGFFGYDPSDPRDIVAGSIPQALAMMNMPRIDQAIQKNGLQTMLGRLLREANDDDSRTVDLYLRVLAREPTNQELTDAQVYIASVETASEAYEDLLWALLNSSEFLHRR